MPVAIHYQESRLRSTIYVSNLPQNTTYNQLRSFFAKHGPVLSTYINSSGGSKRQFGLITFQDAKVTLALISVGKLLFRGSMCYISERKNPYHANDTNQAAEPECAREAAIEPITNNAHCTEKVESTPLSFDTWTEEDEATPYETARESTEVTAYKAPVNYKKVVRVEGVPHDWDAHRLYRHLTDIGLPITACLVYDDYDEHGSKQGMIQLPNLYSAQRLCEQSLLQTSMVTLNVVRSAVASIGPIRRSYTGEYTAYSEDDEPVEALSFTPCETYSYSMTEPCEPRADAHSGAFGLSPIKEWSSPPASSDSPGLDDDKGTSVTPMSVMSNDCFHTSKTNFTAVTAKRGISVMENECARVNNGGICVTDNEGVRVDNEGVRVDNEGVRVDNGGVRVDNEGICVTDNGIRVTDSGGICVMGDRGDEVFSHCYNGGNKDFNDFNADNDPHGTAVFKTFKPSGNIVSFQPGIVLPKPSTTVVIDNLSKFLMQDARSLAAWMQQFGDVRTSDLVPVSEQYYRAYISFWHPFNADLALRNLVAGDLVMHRFQVRLA